MTGTRKIRHLWLFSFCADFLGVAAAYYTTLLVRFQVGWGGDLFSWINQRLGVRPTGALGLDHERFYWVSAPRIILLMTATLCVIYALRDLYAGRRFIRRRPVAWDVMVSNGIALIIFYAYFYMRRNTWHPRSMFVTVLILNVVYTVIFRRAADGFLGWVRRRCGLDRCRAVLVGHGPDADYMADLIDTCRPQGISIAYRMRYDPAMPFQDWVQELGGAVSRNGAELAILAERQLSVDHIMSILQLGGRLGISVKVLSDKLNVVKDQAKIAVDIVRGLPLVHFEGPGLPSLASVLRRGLSLALGVILLVVASPVMLLTAILIKLTSRGPVFFVQERIGVNRKPFRMIKFRTMHERAEEEQAAVEEFNESGTLFKIKRDPRVTLIGRLLRRLSLDELPQLINVVRGEMALVGPRPLPRRDFENYYEEWHYSRHEGIPGLTCLWQVSGRSDVEFHEMCILDVYYLRNRSWVLDLEIAMRTAWVVIFGKGAY